MAFSIQRHSVQPLPGVTVFDDDGRIQDLTGWAGRAKLYYKSVLHSDLSNSSTLLRLTRNFSDTLVEVGDLIEINEEVVIITAVPTPPQNGAYLEYSISRGQNHPAYYPELPSWPISGKRNNRFKMSDDVSFTIEIFDGSTIVSTSHTITRATSNSYVALSSYVSNISAALGAYGASAAAFQSTLGQFSILRTISGADQRITLSNVDDEVTYPELGIVNGTSWGYTAIGTAAVSHNEGAEVRIIKRNRPVLFHNPLSEGRIFFPLIPLERGGTGDLRTDGNFYIDFLLRSPTGGKLTLPADRSMLLAISSNLRNYP